MQNYYGNGRLMGDWIEVKPNFARDEKKKKCRKSRVLDKLCDYWKSLRIIGVKCGLHKLSRPLINDSE